MEQRERKWGVDGITEAHFNEGSPCAWSLFSKTNCRIYNQVTRFDYYQKFSDQDNQGQIEQIRAEYLTIKPSFKITNHVHAADANSSISITYLLKFMIT